MNSIHNTSVDKFVSEILNSNISYLSRAITLVESNNSKHQAKANLILEQCLPHSNKSVRIGITGVPGVGKSTFIEVFGKYLTRLGKKVAVLAIDPSSSIQKGSILGDKTRMETLVNDENAFIRPSPSGESLGGVARKTRETITLCEAAGFDVIIIETVGVGQSETTVHSMVDFFLLLKLANAGDELQGIKRGIIEMADAIAINKADGLNVKETNLAKTEFANALHLFPAKESDWIPKVVTCSALDNKGIDAIYKMISEYFSMTKKNGYFHQKRNSQNKNWLLETIDNELKNEFYQNEKVQESMKEFIKKIEDHEINPFQAAKEILKIKR
ncbi:MAG: LAO/AO transport system kinase [Candidatus Azotimanducaceae bacterium]